MTGLALDPGHSFQPTLLASRSSSPVRRLLLPSAEPPSQAEFLQDVPDLPKILVVEAVQHFDCRLISSHRIYRISSNIR